jgi:hypothetical protein
VREIEKQPAAYLDALRQRLTDPKKQPNAQIAELVTLDFAIDVDAPVGDREVRLVTPQGLTNPLTFQVGALPEVIEGDILFRRPDPVEPLALPTLINGQIMPGDTDTWRFRAKAGQRLVLVAQARRLIPYLADAVPGWFQAALTLYDGKGKELAYDDDYRFNPDPVLFYVVPADGEYKLEIRDAIYRGREDFIYRVALGELPFITGMWPLGGRLGERVEAAISGWNLPAKRLPFDTEGGRDGVREAHALRDTPLLNSITYAVDALPDVEEAEPNDLARGGQAVRLPCIVNGRIGQPGDVDAYRFDGKAGESIVVEVMARRVQSPLDSVMRLLDAGGKVIAWNDDFEDPRSGMITHHADSYLLAKLPADGTYRVTVTDAAAHGGTAFGYRLRLGAPRPDFALRLAPATINVGIGMSAEVWVHCTRLDGFDGPIDLRLQGAPAGFQLSGARIPAGQAKVRMTLTAPSQVSPTPATLRLEGRATVGGAVVTRPVVPTEDLMQAFAYRHLVPCQEWVINVHARGRGGDPLRLVDDKPVSIPLGGTAQAVLKSARRFFAQNLQLELDDPPKGITLEKTQWLPEGVALTLKADAQAAKAGLAGNLIVEVFTEVAPPPDAKRKPQRFSVGVLPAVPFEVVAR